MSTENKENKPENKDTGTADTETPESLADDILGGEPIAEESEEENTDPEKEEGGEEEGGEPAEEEGAEEEESDPEKKKEGEEAKKTEEENKADPDKKDEEDLYVEPEGLGERGKERFQKLVASSKEKDTQIEENARVITGFREMIEDTGVAPKEFAEGLDAIKLVNTGSQEAVDYLYNMAKQVAQNNGHTLPGLNALEGHDDLQKSVDNMEMTQTHAEELAISRNRNTAETKAAETKKQQDDELSSVTQGFDSAMDELKTFITDIEKNDIDWEKKAPHIQEAAKYAAENLPPEKWLGYMEREHKRVGNMMKSLTPKGQTKTPLGSDSTKTGKKTPTTSEELADNIFG